MIVLLACSLIVHAAAVEPSVEIMSAYQFPQNVCKALIRNHNDEPLDLRKPDMTWGVTDRPMALWTMAEPDMVAPGETAWITSLFTAAFPARGVIPMRLLTADKEIPFIAQANPRLVVTYSVQVPEEEKVYIFVLNAAAENCTITAADVNDVPVAVAQPVEIPAARNAVLYGKCSVRPAPEFEVPQVIIRLTPSGRLPVQVFGRLFRPEHTVLRGAGNTFDMIDCLSHAHGDDTTAATKAIAAAAGQRGTLRTIKFCNIDVGDNAAATFAQITERNHIEPQLAYSDECASGDYVQTLLESVENVRRATQPGITYAWVLPSNIHDPSSPPYGIARLRTMIYAMLAGGSKGLELFSPEFQDVGGAHAQANNRLLAELAPLRPLIALSEPVDLLESGEPAGYVVRTLVCGDKGILLFVLPIKDNVAHEGREGLRIRSPGYPLGEEGFEITSGDSFSVAQRDSGQYEIDLPLTSEAHLYLISAR